MDVTGALREESMPLAPTTAEPIPERESRQDTAGSGVGAVELRRLTKEGVKCPGKILPSFQNIVPLLKDLRGARPRLPTAFREGRWAAEVVKVGPNVKEIALLRPYAKVRVVPVGLDSCASNGVCSR